MIRIAYQCASLSNAATARRLALPALWSGGRAIRDYLPYVYLFSLGEVFRNGVQHHVQVSLLVKAGYLVLSASEYVVFAPLYWYLFFRNLKRHRQMNAEGSGPR